MSKEVKNFYKIVDLTVERVKLSIAESPKSSETKITDIRKRIWLIHILRHGCVLRTVLERRRHLTGGTMMVGETKNEKVQKNKGK